MGCLLITDPNVSHADEVIVLTINSTQKRLF